MSNRCKTCDAYNDVDLYYHIKDGLEVIQHYCRDCWVIVHEEGKAFE